MYVKSHYHVFQLHDKEQEHQEQIQELNFQLERLQHDYRIEREQHLVCKTNYHINNDSPEDSKLEKIFKPHRNPQTSEIGKKCIPKEFKRLKIYFLFFL